MCDVSDVVRRGGVKTPWPGSFSIKLPLMIQHVYLQSKAPGQARGKSLRRDKYAKHAKTINHGNFRKSRFAGKNHDSAPLRWQAGLHSVLLTMFFFMLWYPLLWSLVSLQISINFSVFLDTFLLIPALRQTSGDMSSDVIRDVMPVQVPRRAGGGSFKAYFQVHLRRMHFTRFILYDM